MAVRGARSCFLAGVALAALGSASASRAEPAPPSVASPSVVPPEPAPASPAIPPRPVQSFELPNGAVVWLGAMPGAVRWTATFPVGAWADPPGREGLAHLVEHLLFFDAGPDGVARAALDARPALAALRAVANATTADEHQHVYVESPPEHAEGALAWLIARFAPRSFDPALVRAEARVVGIELSKKGSSAKRVRDRWWQPAPRDPWTEALGVRLPRPVGTTTLRAGLAAITVADVDTFRETYLHPANLTLSGFGDLPAEEGAAWTRDRVGALPAGPPAFSPRRPAAPPGRPIVETAWQASAGLPYVIDLFVAEASGDDIVALEFLRLWLREYLHRRLRWQEQAAYRVTTELATRGGHARLRLAMRLTPQRAAEARAQVEGLLADLAAGAVDAEAFEAAREHALRAWRTGSDDPKERSARVVALLHPRIWFREYPDLERRFAEIRPEEVAGFLSQRAPPGLRRVRRTLAPPLPTPGPLGWALLVAPAVVAVARARHRAPLVLDPPPVVANLRRSVDGLLFGPLPGLLSIAALALGLSWLAPAAERLLLRSGSFALTWLSPPVLIAAAGLALLEVGARWPAKLLITPDRLIVKSWLWRTRRFDRKDVRAVPVRGWLDALRRRRRWVRPWHALGEGLLIEVGGGAAFFVCPTHRERVLRALQAPPPSPGPGDLGPAG